MVALDFMLKPRYFGYFLSGYFSDFTLQHLSMTLKLITFYLIFNGILWLMMLLSLLLIFIVIMSHFTFLNVLFVYSDLITALRGWLSPLSTSSCIDYVYTQAILTIFFCSLALFPSLLLAFYFLFVPSPSLFAISLVYS